MTGGGWSLPGRGVGVSVSQQRAAQWPISASVGAEVGRMKTASPKRRGSRRSPPKISAVEKSALRIMRKLYEATGGQPQRWESLGNLGATKADAAGLASPI